MKLKTRRDYRTKRHQRIRRKISGTAERPRMAIMRSNRYLYVQFIDDERATTMAAVTSMGDGATAKNSASASTLGQRAAEAAMAKGIKQVVVDRSGFKFHGRVKAIVDAAVAHGLSISQKTAAPAEDAAASTDDNQEAK